MQWGVGESQREWGKDELLPMMGGEITGEVERR